MSCENNIGPTFILDPALGTTPCPSDDSTSTTPPPCDPQACCNVFNPVEAVGNGFIYSQGGPFVIGVPGFVGDNCVAGDLYGDDLHPLPDTGAPGFVAPGALADVICAENFGITPGTYEVKARLEIRNATPGTRVVVLVRPECETGGGFYDGPEYLVLNCDVPEDCGEGPRVNKVCSAPIYVESTRCAMGFRILGVTGCPNDTSQVPPSLDNFQISFTPVSKRILVGCGGTDNVAWADPGTPAPNC